MWTFCREKSSHGRQYALCNRTTTFYIIYVHARDAIHMEGHGRGRGAPSAAHGPTWAAGRTAAAGTASGVTARLKKEATSSAATSDSTARKAAAAASLMSGVRCSKPTTPSISFVEDCSRALRNSAVAVHTAACNARVAGVRRGCSEGVAQVRRGCGEGAARAQRGRSRPQGPGGPARAYRYRWR